MIRSRVQLATSYAPGVLLTWEGGKGICRSVPARRPLRLERTTERQIFDGIREFAENWQSRALAVRPAGGVPPALALDPDFFDPRTNRVEIDQQHFDPTDPSVVGYVPYPLVFQCGVCSKIREYTPVEELDRQPLPRRCGAHDARWGQVDVVYAHWSGSIEPLSPSGYRFDPADSRVHQIDVCTCGARNYSLRNRAPVFSEWRFVCNECGATRELKKPDHDTYEIFEAARLAGGRQYEFIEVNMLLVSYRANSAFYPHLYVTCYTEGFSHFVTSMTAPVASGWSIRRVGLAPTGKAPPLHGAHVKRTLRIGTVDVEAGGKPQFKCNSRLYNLHCANLHGPSP